jgi:hypothetical protein
MKKLGASCTCAKPKPGYYSLSCPKHAKVARKVQIEGPPMEPAEPGGYSVLVDYLLEKKKTT